MMTFPTRHQAFHAQSSRLKTSRRRQQGRRPSSSFISISPFVGPCPPLYARVFDYSPHTYVRGMKLNTTRFVCSKSSAHTETSDVSREACSGGNVSQLHGGAMTPPYQDRSSSAPPPADPPRLGVGTNVTPPPLPRQQQQQQHNKRFTPARPHSSPTLVKLPPTDTLKQPHHCVTSLWQSHKEKATLESPVMRTHRRK